MVRMHQNERREIKQEENTQSSPANAGRRQMERRGEEEQAQQWQERG